MNSVEALHEPVAVRAFDEVSLAGRCPSAFWQNEPRRKKPMNSMKASREPVAVRAGA